MAQRGGVALLALRGLVRGGGRLRVTVVEGSREVLLELPLFARVLLGRLHRADAAWRVFQSIAGVAVDFPEARRNERHRGAADHRRRRAPTASLLDGAMWDAFCRHYRRDYRCLGFDPPPACASRWGGPA